MSQIKSKIHNYANVNESDWPPRFPKKNNSGRFYWDHEAQEFKSGNPPNPNNCFGQAPIAIMDSMPKTYHEGAQREVESRQEWERLDKEHNKLTFGSLEEARKHTAQGRKEEKKALIADRRNARKQATQAYKENPKAVKEKLRADGDRQMKEMKKTGLDVQLKKAGVEIL